MPGTGALPQPFATQHHRGRARVPGVSRGRRHWQQRRLRFRRPRALPDALGRLRAIDPRHAVRRRRLLFAWLPRPVDDEDAPQKRGHGQLHERRRIDKRSRADTARRRDQRRLHGRLSINDMYHCEREKEKWFQFGFEGFRKN